MDFLERTCPKWRRRAGTRLFPQPENLPVLVAVRMSLSFPLLFSSVELYMEDFELPVMLKSLGAEKVFKRIRRVTFSDGGLSSNFPVHLLVDALTAAYRGIPAEFKIPAERRDEIFPKKRGKLAIGPTY